MAKKSAANNQLIGLCGEHYVAAVLAGFDLMVAVPRGGSARDDLFVANSNRGRAIRLQVKTARDPYAKYQGKRFCSWHTNSSIIDTHDDSLWYAFVALNGWPSEPKLPEILPVVLFVPSMVVANCLAEEKKKRLDDLSAKGKSTDKYSSPTFFWIFCDQEKDDAAQYRNTKGIERLKEALAHSCNQHPEQSP